MNWFTKQELLDHFSSPMVAFVLLFIISHLIYMRLFSRQMPSLASGSILMALSVFALDALRELNVPFFFMIYVALEIMIIGLYLGINLMQGILEDEISIKESSDKLAIGTWIAGIVITIILLNQIERTLIGFIALLSIIAISLFIYYIYVIVKWFLLYFSKSSPMQVNGNLFMAAVSMQAMALLLSELFHDDIAPLIYQVIILSGIVLYLLALVCLGRYLYVSRSKNVVAGWSNESTILHAALSITGFAMITTLSFPDWSIHFVLLFTIIAFIAVEAMELYRLYTRFKLKTLKKAITLYHTSQWLRIFAFGMFYSFILTYYQYEYSNHGVIYFIATYGQYVVATLMCAEIFILLKYLLQQEKAK